MDTGTRMTRSMARAQGDATPAGKPTPAKATPAAATRSSFKKAQAQESDVPVVVQLFKDIMPEDDKVDQDVVVEARTADVEAVLPTPYQTPVVAAAPEASIHSPSCSPAADLNFMFSSPAAASPSMDELELPSTGEKPSLAEYAEVSSFEFPAMPDVGAATVLETATPIKPSAQTELTFQATPAAATPVPLVGALTPFSAALELLNTPAGEVSSFTTCTPAPCTAAASSKRVSISSPSPAQAHSSAALRTLPSTPYPRAPASAEDAILECEASPEQQAAEAALASDDEEIATPDLLREGEGEADMHDLSSAKQGQQQEPEEEAFADADSIADFDATGIDAEMGVEEVVSENMQPEVSAPASIVEPVQEEQLAVADAKPTLKSAVCAADYDPRSLASLKREIAEKIAAKASAKQERATAGVKVHTLMEVRDKVYQGKITHESDSEDEEDEDYEEGVSGQDGSDLAAAMGGLGLSRGHHEPLQGLPENQGRHTRFSDHSSTTVFPARSADCEASASSAQAEAPHEVELAEGEFAPLKGLPQPMGRHIRFDAGGDAIELPTSGKVVLQGLPAATGSHMRFD
ncbi:MAG: hypothetical protein WDW36_006211 [Sanguina aurantia]